MWNLEICDVLKRFASIKMVLWIEEDFSKKFFTQCKISSLVMIVTEKFDR